MKWKCAVLGWVLVGGCTLSQSAQGAPVVEERDARVPRAPRPPREDAPSDDAPSEQVADEEEPTAEVPRPKPASEEPTSPASNLDAGFVGSLDASTPILASDAAVDAGACGGSLTFDLCWYLAPAGLSCDEHCAAHGGFDERAIVHVGTPWQGGSAGACAQVLGDLGLQGVVTPALRYDLRGLGCHRWAGASTYWIEAPYLARFRPDQRAPQAELACACVR